ncbi:cardiomyopathy-associated protein 5 [Genypterus blacodes]|uniref:cardiomyopathy-associated protein 5 n=1 Tax=Genypterus blacodes TaxID=154954 RepID=UPI003F759C1E
MEECESLGSEVGELNEFQCEAPEEIDQDDEDEVEELQNSLREAVQDPSVKPKLQCLMVDPSFSMVTVQSEDSGIVWETASSRCSTPWASETSSISEAYSMEGSGAAGKITIVFDEEKITRRRIRSGGRISRLGDRLSRQGSSRSASALGVERPEMAEVSLPNIKQEKTDTEADLEEIKDKDQQLFSLISEGYEILNIRVPSKLPTVDEEESTELQENLSYLDQTPRIKSRKQHDGAYLQNHVSPGEEEEGESQEHQEPSKQDSDQQSADTVAGHTQTDSTGDMDYFEKFTLLDEIVPVQQAPELQEDVAQPVAPAEEEKPGQEAATDSPEASEDSFVFVTDVEIPGEHLDEVFYGNGAQVEALEQKQDNEDEAGAPVRTRRESQRSGGSVLFTSEETTLTPIFISPGPPKIIDLILLEEPTAMSFMYSDLYEDAMGERRRSDGECSEAESVITEKSYKRDVSDPEGVDGYLEKFTLKDEIPMLEVKTDLVEDKREGRMLWAQSEFEMTGCLSRVLEEKEEEEEGARTSEDLTQDCKLVERKVEDVEVEHKVEEEQGKSSTDKLQPETQQVDVKVEKTEESEEGQPEETAEEVHETHQTPKTKETVEEFVKEAEKMEVEVAQMVVKSDIQTESAEFKAAETEMEETCEEVDEITPPKTEEAETVRTEELSPAEQPAEMETSAKTSLRDKTEAAEPEHAAPAEVITAGIKEVAEETEPAAHEEEIQTQLQVSPQEAPSVEVTGEEKGQEERVTEESAVENQCSELITEAETDISREDTDSEKKQVQIKKTDERITASQSETGTVSEVEDKTTVEDNGETVNQGGEFILLVPKGQTVEVDIEIDQESEEIPENVEVCLTEDKVCLTEDKVCLTEDKVCLTEDVLSPEKVPEYPQPLPEDNIVTETEPEEKTEMAGPEALPKEDLDRSSSPPHCVEDAYTEEETPEKNLKDIGVLFPLRSFTPQEDLSELQRVDQSKAADVDPNAEVQHKVADVPEKDVMKGDVGVETELHRKDEKQKIEHEEEAAAGPEVTAEDLDYEIISKQETREETDAEMERDTERDTEETKPEPEERAEMAGVEVEKESEDRGLDLSPEDRGLPLSPLDRGLDLAPQDRGLHLSSEDRGLDLSPEDRRLDLSPEDRGFDLSPKDRGLDLCPEDRGLDLSPEDRGFDLSPKDRGLDLSPEDRGFDLSPEDRGLDLSPKDRGFDLSPEDRGLDLSPEDRGLDMSPEEDLTEADYDFIDAEEERQARLAAELQGMDWFCLTCGCLLSEDDCGSAEHRGHVQTSVNTAYDNIKERLSEWISELQGRSENIEDLVSELELAYNSVEDLFLESEDAMQAQNEEMMAQVMEQYNNMSFSMEEEKKAKLERLYDQIVSFQGSVDTAKATLETAAREAETDARVSTLIDRRDCSMYSEDKGCGCVVRLKAALEAAMSLELGPRAVLAFEDYAKGNTSNSHLAQSKAIPVPERPTLQRQEPGSATSSSVTVYWTVNPGDIIDCFQVYCMEDPQGAVTEEYRVTVKESHCALEELEPDKTYKVWVMAVNYTGCSLPSERLLFRTAPSVPVIDTERCTITWDSATLRWNSDEETPGQSFTLEYCRQCELEGEGLRSVSGIKSCEQKVLVQPNENYLFYIKAVNEAGASEQSEAALISTKGTRFRLLEESAHPSLELSADQSTVHYCEDDITPSTDKQCLSILGELLPARGHHYWETTVSEGTAHRLGVAYRTVNRNSPLGENSMSWCLQCLPTLSSCRYRLLHNEVQSDLTLISSPERVGTLLDYQLGRLSFYNALTGQLLATLNHSFTQPCHPALGLDTPGSLELIMVPEVPEFAKHS